MCINTDHPLTIKGTFLQMGHFKRWAPLYPTAPHWVPEPEFYFMCVGIWEGICGLLLLFGPRPLRRLATFGMLSSMNGDVLRHLKVRVKLPEFSWQDLTYFGPIDIQYFDIWDTFQSFTFHAHYWECILRGIILASNLEINSHLNIYSFPKFCPVSIVW